MITNSAAMLENISRKENFLILFVTTPIFNKFHHMHSGVELRLQVTQWKAAPHPLREMTWMWEVSIYWAYFVTERFQEQIGNAAALRIHAKKDKVTVTKILIVCPDFNVALTIARMNFPPIQLLGIVPLTAALNHRKYRNIKVILLLYKCFGF